MNKNNARGREVVLEVPLPSDWDKTALTPQKSYKSRIEYIVQRAQKLGKGSSRTAFIIDYQGRQTVLKVAHNAKGMAQNGAEAQILDDPYIADIVIPIIDYDEEHAEPVWIHTEMANKATEKKLCDIMKCGKLINLVGRAEYQALGKRGWAFNGAQQYYESLDEQNKETFDEYTDSLAELTGFGLNLGDFQRAANWGLYRGHPVVIDLGFTNEVAATYYR